MFSRPFRNPSGLDRRHEPQQRCAPSRWRPPRTGSPGTPRVFFWLFDLGVPVRLRFQGQNLPFVNDTCESRLMVALLDKLDSGSFLTYAEARDAICPGMDDPRNAVIRQAKCRLNRLLLQRLGPVYGVDPGEPSRNADWVLCRRGRGYLLNPAAEFVFKSDEFRDRYASPGRRYDVGTWATDQTKPVEMHPDDEPATGPAASANPYIATPSTAWKRARQARAQTSPLLKSIRPRTRPDG